MGGKKTIIIIISLIAAGLLAYFIFFSGESEEGDSLPSSYNGTNGSSKSSKKNKRTNPNANNTPLTNGVAAQSDIITPEPKPDSQSFQTLNSKQQSHGYFNPNVNLQFRQINGNSNNTEINSGDDSTPSRSSPNSRTQSSAGVSSGGTNGVSGASGGGTNGTGTSTYPARLQSCVGSLQPILDAKSTDTTEITNALLNIMGFSMIPIATQNTYINSVATQAKGTSAQNYCKILLQNTNPQTIDVSGIFTNCKVMVQNLYNQKGSNATESDSINAIASIGIANGATTYAQQKTVIQNYLGGEYSYVIAAMSNLNSTNLDSQSNIICSKLSSGIVNAVNGSSAYLSCITTANSAKEKNITSVATALPSYAKLTVANQTLMTTYYRDFLSGTKTVESMCAFLSRNATVVQSATARTLSGMILQSSVDLNTICSTVVRSIQSEYDDYLSNPNIDYVANIERSLDSYEFLISDTYRANVVKYLITNRITNASFNTLSADNKANIMQRLYATNYSLSAFTNPAISGIYTELFPQLCKCTHMDFGDMAWKEAVVSYMILKQSGGTAIPSNILSKQAVIVNSDFYKSCHTKIKTSLASSNITSSGGTAAIVKRIQSIDSTFNMRNIDGIVAPLSCYIEQCIGKACPQSCLVAVDSACEKLTIQYLQDTPAAANMNTLFDCPQTESGRQYDAKVCYNLTEAQRVGMSQNFYDAILSFKNTATGIRKTIIQNLWKTHAAKQKSNNTSVAPSQCVEESNSTWSIFLTTQAQ